MVKAIRARGQWVHVNGWPITIAATNKALRVLDGRFTNLTSNATLEYGSAFKAQDVETSYRRPFASVVSTVLV